MEQLRPIRPDTTPGAHRAYIANIRRMTPAARFVDAVNMSMAGIDVGIATIQRVNPTLTKEEARLLLIERMFGAELADRARQAWARLQAEESDHGPVAATQS